jgi:hypothetical protein
MLFDSRLFFLILVLCGKLFNILIIKWNFCENSVIIESKTPDYVSKLLVVDVYFKV